MKPEDQNQDPEGAEGSAGPDGRQNGTTETVEELQARLRDKDRKNTELATRLAALEKRIEVGIATHEDEQEAAEIEKELEGALEEAVVDPKSAAKKLREVVQKRIRVEVKSQASAATTEADRIARAKAAIQADVDAVFQKFPDLKPFEGEIARRARVIMQGGVAFKEAMFEAAEKVAHDQDEIFKKRTGGQVAPRGSQAEGGNPSSASVSGRKGGSSQDDLRDDPNDYLAERKARQEKAHNAG